VVGQFEEALERVVQAFRSRAWIATRVEVGTADVAYEQGIARENEPGLFGPAAPVGDDVCVVRGCVARCGERPDERVPELDKLTVTEGHVLEIHLRPGRQISGRARLGERWQSGHVVRLQVRLEDGSDRSTEAPRFLEVFVDEVGVRVDDREPPVGEAAEDVARAGRGGKEEGP
jgi:hypothetical protein